MSALKHHQQRQKGAVSLLRRPFIVKRPGLRRQWSGELKRPNGWKKQQRQTHAWNDSPAAKGTLPAFKGTITVSVLRTSPHARPIQCGGGQLQSSAGNGQPCCSEAPVRQADPTDVRPKSLGRCYESLEAMEAPKAALSTLCLGKTWIVMNGIAGGSRTLLPFDVSRVMRERKMPHVGAAVGAGFMK